MSRGLGRVERSVLKIFEDNPSELLDGVVLTFRIHGDEPTWSQYSSTRRALNSLQQKGFLATPNGRFAYGRKRYGLPQRVEEYTRRMHEVFGR
jgi:hypothetical protein